MLGALEPLGALFRHRVPGDPVIERYVECLGGELRRAQAAASQVASLARHQDLDPTPRLVELASVMQLRVPAWRGWLPSDASLELREEPGTPPVEVWPELLGPAVDELVAAMVRRVPAKPALRLSVGPLRVARSTSGLGAELGARAGACARLVLAVAPAPSADAAGGDDEERAIERASIVARAHGGALQVSERRVGDGLESLVEIVLPRGDGRRLHARSGEEPARSRSLLVVDDEQEIRAIAREMLEFRGHRVHGASSGEEAIELFEAGCRYDLVLLDRQMGGLDGRETFHRLKGIDPDARVVLVSGSATTADLRKLLGEGMLGYLAKPFSMKDLVSTVESALRS
jgi:CheY-like chemotaxis protein